jgi:hypothetical protein
MRKRTAMLKDYFPVLLIALLAIGALLRFANFNNVAARSPDEWIYTRQAGIISTEGPIAGTRALVEGHNQNSRLWTLPPPTRIGYDWLLAGVMKLSGSTDERAGASISFAASILSLVLITVTGLRFFNPLVALFALMFMAVSPVELVLSRRSWQEALFGFLGLCMVHCTLAITRNPKRLIWYILLLVTGSYIILVKELGAAVYGLCALWVICVLLAKEKSLAKTLIFITASGAVLAAGYAFIAYAVGGFDTLLGIFGHIKDGLLANQYAIDMQSGPWLDFIGGFWVFSPFVFVLFISGVISTFLPWPIAGENGAAKPFLAWLLIFIVVFFGIALLPPYCQNYRYVSIANGPIYLVAGAGLWYLASLVRPAVRSILAIVIPLAALVLIFGAIRDYRLFEKYIIGKSAIDIPVKILRIFPVQENGS